MFDVDSGDGREILWARNMDNVGDVGKEVSVDEKHGQDQDHNAMIVPVVGSALALADGCAL